WGRPVRLRWRLISIVRLLILIQEFLMNITKLLTISLLIFSYEAYSAEVPSGPMSFFPGLLKGEEFLNLNEANQAIYVMGVIDGFLASPVFGAENKYYSWLGNCLKDKTNTQISAMATKYLKNNPGMWDNEASLSIHTTLILACSK
ncbi:MAG: hypothetical protein ACRDGA_01685, partial [Bacteroidota bacterium]